MDFTTSGAAGFAGDLKNQELKYGDGRSASHFAELPKQGDFPSRNGPVMLMPPPAPTRRRNVWAQRIWLIVFVLFCLEVGIILMWCPWTKVWSENSILTSFPRLREFMMQNFVRGVISGLGVVNIWMGIAEAVRYREGQE